LVIYALLWSFNSPAGEGIGSASIIPAASSIPQNIQSLTSDQGQTSPTSLRWGASAPDMLLRDSLDRRITLSRFRNRQLLIVIFSHYSCPAHHLYLPKLIALEPLWKRLDGEALWVFPHSLSGNMAPFGHALLLEDKGGKTFVSYGIRKTPHIVVLQRNKSTRKGRYKDIWKVCYSGSVDADPEGLQPSVRPDLAEALRDLEFSNYVRIPQTPLHGCPYPYPNHP
jgi:hypothetical protein